MENFDVVQALARTALGGSGDAVAHQVHRLAERLRKSGDNSEARSLDRLIAQQEKRQATEPVDFSPASAQVVADTQSRLTRRTTVPVDKDSGVPLCEIVFPDRRRRLPVLPAQANEAYEALRREWSHEAKLTSYALPVSRSMLVYGPPGTGKTTLALAIAAHLALPAVVARLDGLISSLLGNTAKSLGALFDFCNRYACVLVLDEFDAVAKVRDDTNEIGEIKRVVNALLQNLDKRAQYGLTIAITNHERLLDPAVWRRFEQQVRIGEPDYAARREIAAENLHTYELGHVVAQVLAALTDGKSGSDVKGLGIAFFKTVVLSDAPDIAPADAMRQAARSTGVALPLLELEDRRLAHVLAEEPSAMNRSDLSRYFGRDRKTIARWLAHGED